MPAWVVDLGLNKLLAQVNALAPNRSKASDGSIGDLAHAGTVSDHNPEDTADADAPGNPDEQVDARDITHDPGHGADMAAITEAIRVSRDKRVKYVIFNRRIYHGTRDAARRGLTAYRWYDYFGDNPHTKHAHVSVEDATHDQTQDWSIMANVTISAAEWQRLHRSVDGVIDAPTGWPPSDESGDGLSLQSLYRSTNTLARTAAAGIPLVRQDIAALSAKVGQGEIIVDAAILREVMLRPEVVETYAKAIAAEIAELHFGVVTP